METLGYFLLIHFQLIAFLVLIITKGFQSIFTAMKSTKADEAYTLEEILSLTNEELLSNWSKLASLIKAYEKVPWDKARVKALELFKDRKTASAFIDTIRKYPDGTVEEEVEPEPVPKTKTQKPAKIKTKDLKQVSIFEKNYERLLKIVPDLEEVLLSVDFEKDFKPIHGNSYRTGFKDFEIEVFKKDRTGYYLTLAHYHRVDSKLITDPEMIVLVNIKKRSVEALSLATTSYFRVVHDDLYKRKLLNVSEENSQNQYLNVWLGELKDQKHQITWDKDLDDDEMASFILDDYQKSKARRKEQFESEKEIPAENQPASEPPQVIQPETPSVEEKQEEKEVIESPKTINMAIEFSDEQTKKLSSIILFLEGPKVKSHEAKALELIESGKALDYLIRGYKEVRKLAFADLFTINFYKLKMILPQVYFDAPDNSKTLVLSPTVTGTTTSYHFSELTVKNKIVKEFAIYESASKERKGGTLLLGVREKDKHVWVETVSDNFDGNADYFLHTEVPFVDASLFINREFGKWLDYLILKRYSPVWLNKSGKTEINNGEAVLSNQTIETPKAETQTAEQAPVKEKSYNPNDEIPDFEIGKVKLTEQHKKHGLTQKDINWINKNKQGFTIIPRTKKMVFNTKSVSMDKAKIAKQPGYRISPTGKLYYESRSNRSDRSRDGL